MGEFSGFTSIGFFHIRQVQERHLDLRPIWHIQFLQPPFKGAVLRIKGAMCTAVPFVIM